MALSLLLALLLVSFILYAHFLIHKPPVQKALVERLSGLTGYRINTGEIELSLWGGVGVLVHGFEAVSPEGADRIEAASVRLLLDPGELLRGRLVPVSLALVRPRLELKITEEETPAAGAVFKRSIPWLPGLESLSMEQATLVIRDRPYGAEGLSLDVRAKGDDPLELTVTSVGRLLFQERTIPFRIRGTLFPGLSTEEVGAFDLYASVDGIPMAWFPWPEQLVFEGGTLDGRFTLKGAGNQPVAASGRAVAREVRFLLHDDGQTKLYNPPEITVLFQGEVEKSHLRFPDTALQTGPLSLQVDLELDLPVHESPHLRMRVESEPMPFELMDRYFPTPLLPPWVENRLFPLLQTGTVRLEHLAIVGSLEEIESLDEPEHAEALSLAVDCRGFRIEGPAVPTPFEEVSARVTYHQGGLTIADLRGSLSDSKVREGRLEIRNILETRPIWDILVDGDFRLQTLMEQKQIDFIPPDALQMLDRLGPMSGSLSCRARFRYEKGWEFPKTREGSFIISEGLIRQPELRLPVRVSEAKIRVTEDEGTRFQATGAWGASAFEAQGNFGAGTTPFALQSAEVSARMHMNEALPVVLSGFELPLAFEGPVATSFSLTRKKNQWRCLGRVLLEEVTLRNDQVSMNPPGAEDHIAFDLLVGPGEHLTLETVLCRFRGSTLELSGGYDLEKKDLFTLEISTPSLDLEDLGLRFHDHGRPSKGRLQGKVKILASRRDSLPTMVLGKVQGHGITAQLHRLPSLIRDASFSLDFSGKTLTVNDCSMRVGESEMSVDGTLEGWRKIKGRMGIHAESLNPKDFLIKRPRSPLSSPLIPDRVNLRLEVHGRTAHWRGLSFGPLRAEVHLKDGEIRLARSRVRLDHGVLTSNGRIRGAPAPEIVLANHVRLTGQPLRELLEGLKFQGPFLDGTLNMEAYLDLQGGSMKDLLPSLSGNADVSIRDGVLGKTSVFSRILEMMSLENMFKGKPSDVSEGGFYFEQMKGFAAINRGVLATENFTMSSPIYNAVAAGEADLNEKTVHFTLGVQPLETLDTIVSRIPIIGYALTGKDRSFLTYYFEVKGPISDPSTRHVPFRHLGSGVAGALKRLFLSPLRLYDHLSGVTKPPAP